MSLRTLLNRCLAPYDLEIRERFRHARRHDASLKLLVQAGFRPGTVIDIGVAHGTPWLYNAFPDAKLVLIDPHPLFFDDLNRLSRDLQADVFAHGLGARPGELDLNVDEQVPGSSSLLTTSSQLRQEWAARGHDRPTHPVSVAVRTLDETLRERSYQGPFLIKVDTEGYELEVLRGASESLAKADVVIAETSVMQRFEGSYEFADLIRLLDDSGFRLFDLLDVKTFGRRGPINYVDAAFVRKQSALFRSRRDSPTDSSEPLA